MSQDYNEAVQSPAVNFADPDLCQGKAVVNALGLPMPCAGNFADVYQVCCPDGARWAVKCFTREVPGLRERYAAIGEHLARARLPFTVEFRYLEQGVRVRGQWYPVLKMEWVEGLLLNEFVRGALDKPAALEALARIFVRLQRRLRAAHVAHGDLQHGNILLVLDAGTGSLALKLVDYDGMYVPALAQNRSGEVGHPAYQHPQRLREQSYGPEVDRFPLLVIYCALRALIAGGRALWDRYDNGDNLLFRQQDLEAPSKSALLYELLALGDPSVRFLAGRLIDGARKPLEQAPTLEELTAEAGLPPPRPPAAVAAKAAALPAPAPSAATSWYLDRSGPALAEAPAPAFAPAEAEPGPRQTDGEPEARRRVIAPLWVALAGTVALLGVLFGVMVLVAKTGAVVSKKEPALAHGDTRIDKTDRDVPGEKALRPKDPVGEIRRFIGHSGDGDGVVDVAFAPDGRTAASGGQDMVVRLWDIETGQEIRLFEGHTGRVTCLCFTPDGLHVVSGSDDKTLRLWDVANGKEVRRFEGHTHNVNYYMAVTPDGQRIISCSVDPEKTVRIWDLKSGKEVRHFRYQGTGTEDVGAIQAFSTDGRWALTAGGDNTLRLWDVGKGTMVRALEGQSRGGAFSADDRFVLGIGQDKYLRLYDMGTGKLIRRFQEGPAAGQLATFSLDGQRVLVSYDQQDYSTLWDVQSGREIYRIAGNPKGAGRIRFSPDGKRALTAGRDGTVRLWGLPD
jgi:WD40 repeat protein